MKKIIKEDKHEEDIKIILQEIGSISKKGIIHIGAHLGEEVSEYLAFGFKNILLIEANPDISNKLREKYKDNAKVQVENALISDKEAIMDFYIHTSRSGSVEPASILKMKKFKEIVPTLKTERILKIKSVPLLKFLAKKNYNIANYNFLNIDVQGAEMLVLKGAEEILNRLDGIIVEVSLIELYENAPKEKEIDDFLKNIGFEKKIMIYHNLYVQESEFPAWAEGLFLKAKN